MSRRNSTTYFLHCMSSDDVLCAYVGRNNLPWVGVANGGRLHL